jgi:magnesium transporter
MGDAMTVLLRRELGLFDEETRHYLQDIYDHLLRVAQTVEAYQDLAAGALEANLTVVSNKVNEVARTLTAYAAIFAALTLVSGVYGMNFAHMPELASWLPVCAGVDAGLGGRAVGLLQTQGLALAPRSRRRIAKVGPHGQIRSHHTSSGEPALAQRAS